MHIIEQKIYAFLEKVKKGNYIIPEKLLNNFGKETKEALRSVFERDPKDFRLSMGNVGRPLCQLQFEASGVQGEDSNNVIRNVYGNLVEDLLIFLLSASGITIISEQERVSLCIGGIDLNGILDVVLDLDDNTYSIWDIKSASAWAFKNKFDNFAALLKDDPYGYAVQLALYTEAKQQSKDVRNYRIGGFIAFDKSSGEIKVVECPKEQSEDIQRRMVELATKNITTLSSIYRHAASADKSNKTRTTVSEEVLLGIADHSSVLDLCIERQFEPKIEYFRKKPTGNLYLDNTCLFCNYKWKCWDNLKLLPQAHSLAQKPQMRYYTKFKGEDNAKKE